MSIAVIMPTRNRPVQAREAVESFFSTAVDATLYAVLDLDSPQLPEYDLPVKVLSFSGNMIERTNLAAMDLIEEHSIIGWMADDNRMRSAGWDIRVHQEFDDPGVGFLALNDLFWSERDKPVNVFIRSSIIRALGWYANPGQRHHYMDDTWRLLGISTDSWRYLPDVVCEHLHPAVGKGEWDASYREQESSDLYATENRAFIDWVQQRFAEDRAKVKQCLRRS